MDEHKSKSDLTKALITIVAVLFIDQAVKFYIKTHFYYNESVDVFGLEWLKIQFVENPGMAFGWQIPFLSPQTAKILLTLFRIVAVSFIGYYLWQKIKGGKVGGMIYSLALIFAGAVGNIVDSVFYGKIFNESINFSDQVATFMPAEGGYTGWLQGSVVDMIFYAARWPEWVPYFGNDYIFPPIFNVADSSITIGVLMILLFQRKYFREQFLMKEEPVLETPVHQEEQPVVPPVENHQA
ncbi:MAG: lipoprotein signal peptidase [Flavobacteriales bacterium]